VQYPPGGQPPQTPPEKTSGYQLSRFVIGPFLHAMGRPRISGLEHVPASGPAILASNHLSIIDSVYLPLMLPRPVVFPAKAEYFSAKGPVGRLWAAYLRSTNQLEMDREGARSAQATLAAAVELLRQGELFGFYPEGTRSPDGRLYRGRSGIGWLALNSGAPVLPVAMFGTRKMMPPGRSLLRPAKIEIKIGKPMEFTHLADDPPARARRAVADEVMRAIADLSGQEYVHEYASDVKARLTEKPDALPLRCVLHARWRGGRVLHVWRQGGLRAGSRRVPDVHRTCRGHRPAGRVGRRRGGA
jgi:1-acyl-sn-glycerol-3-phosphate acyltransferase